MATITVDRNINADDVFAMSGGTPCFVALTTGSVTYHTNLTGYSNWVGTATMTNAAGGAPVASNWQSVCYGNNIVVAVSSTTGTIAATSPAGATATWTARVMPVSASWYQVAYGNGVFVATTSGLGSATNAAATSTNGVDWTSRNMSVSGNWQALCYGNGKFVALSNSSTDIAYSTDYGATWLPATTTGLSARAWSSVVWGGDKFVAVATSSDKGAYSADGITWYEMDMPSSSNWKSVTYGNSTFVAVSNTSGTLAASSTNGTSWNTHTLPATATWVGVTFGNNLFIAIASSSATGGAFSYDGANWQTLATVSLAVSCIAYTPTTWNSNDTLVIQNNATVTVNTNQTKFWNAVTLTNGKLVIDNDSTAIGDAIRFTMGRVTGAAACAITPGSGIGDIEITGNWITLDTGDGTSGQEMTAPFSDYIPCLWVETAASSDVYEVWLNATGSYGDTAPVLTEGLSAVGSGTRGKFFIQQAATAPYGPLTLTVTSSPVAQKLIDVSDTDGLYPGASISGPSLPVNAVVNSVVSSTRVEINANTVGVGSPDWTSVAYGNVGGTTPTYVAVSSGFSDIAATSADGATWTQRTMPFKADWTSVCWGATTGLFVAVASDRTYGCGYCATSPNGETWTIRMLPSVQNWTAVASNGTSYVIVGQTAANAATTAGASSTDGLTWAATVMTSAIWKAVCYGNSRYLAVSSTTLSNYDLDGAGTWTNGGAMTSANYAGVTYGNSRFVAVSGSNTTCRYSTDGTSWSSGSALPNSTSRGIAWDGTNFVVVSTTNSVITAYDTNGSSTWSTSTMGETLRNNWTAVCANGSTLVAVASSSNLRSAAMTSTNSGVAWTLQTGIPSDITLTCFNPYVAQLTNIVQFGDGVNGKKVPTNAKVRCPNIMFTSDTPADKQTSSRIVGANMVMSNGGSLTASICLFDESYNNFLQAEIVSMTNVGCSLPPLLQECYNVSLNSVGFALEPVRRYYNLTPVTMATGWQTGWFSRDTRYGNSATNIWNYINDAVISDLNVAVGQPLALQANQTGATVTGGAGAALTVTNTQRSTWNNIRFYSLNASKNYDFGLTCNPNFENNTITNIEAYGLGAVMLGVSSTNTITNITFSEDMFNGTKNMASGCRIGNDPVAGAHLLGDGTTRYYIKTRTFRDWTDRTSYYEGRVVSSTPYLGSQYHPPSLSVYNSATRAVTLNWVRRDPTSGTVSYTIYRGATADFTRNSTSRIFYSPTSSVATYTNGFVAGFTASAGRTLRFYNSTRIIECSTGSFISDGFVAGANVVVTGTSSNDGIYMILSVAATQIVLTTNHTNLTNEGPSSSLATVAGQEPSNSSTYYYRLQKYDSALTMTTNCSGTLLASTTLTTSSNFNTGLGTIINCEGIAGSNKIRIPVGSTTNFLAGNVTPGLKLSGTGVGTDAAVVSIDTPWQISVSVENSSTIPAGTTLSFGAYAGMYIYGPGLAWPTKVVSVDSSTQITVDTAFLAAFTNQTMVFMHGNESAAFECYVNGPTTPAFNFLTYSDDFTSGNWVKTTLTATANQKQGPNDVPFSSNGATTIADRLTSTGTNGKAVQTITNLKIDSAYTFSVYVMTDPTVALINVDGEISIDTSTPTTQIFSATGEWQRITATFTATSATHAFTIQINDSSTLLPYIYAATAMVNPGSSALPPVTTTTVKLCTGSGARTLQFYPYSSGAATSNTIAASSGSFTTDGFVTGDSIIVYGTTSNDGQYVLSNVAALVLTVTPAQPLTAEGPISAGTITGSILAAAAQELTLAAAWSRSTGGNDTNQGIELTLATIPSGSHYTEVYLGTASDFEPSDVNRVGYASMPGAQTPISLYNASNNKIDTLTQAGYGGLSGYLIYLSGSSNNKFLDFAVDFNYAIGSAVVANISALSNNNTLDDFTIKNWRNYIAVPPFTLSNNASGLALQNITFNHYDIPYYTATNAALGVVMKGVTGGHAEPLTSATIFPLGATIDGVGVSFTAVYDTIFHENFRSPTTGALVLRFNASVQDDPPYTIVAGTPAFSNTGKLYLRTAGDSMEFTWPHRIYTVSGFRDIPIKYNTYDLGQTTTTNPDSAFSLLTEYAVDTGSGYGEYKTATPANLAAESVSTTTGFFIKIKITARAGMQFSTQLNPFEVGEVIRGAASGDTATVAEIYKLTTTTGAIILTGATGSFSPGELIVRNSDSQSRATNVVTNGQFALFPSHNSYVDGLEIYTNTVSPGDYPGQTVNVVLTNVVEGSRYYVFKTSDQTLLGTGDALDTNENYTETSTGIGTVTIPNVTYVANFNVTIRVRKATAAPKYLPLETQGTVTSAGTSVYIGQVDDGVVGASVSGTIAGDFAVNTTSKTIKHTADAVVYTSNELYTWLMDYFDDTTTIVDTVPMSAQTPTEYTLTNGWFTDNASFKYLSGGAIQTDGQDSYDTHVLTVIGGTYADPVSGDIYKTVMAGATSIGPLLDYEIISAGVSSKWYVRDTRTVPAQIASTTALTISTGTGSGNNSTNSLTGESIWSNIFSLGSIVSGTTLDLYQNDSQITPWWPAGQIDILVKVKEAGTEIDSGNLTILARKYSTLYDHYAIDASTGRNPIPLSALNDTSNQTAEGTVGAYTGFTFDFGYASKDLSNGNGAQPYDCVVECNNHTIQEIYEYLKYVTRTLSSTTLNGVNGKYYQAVGDIRLNYTGEANGPFVEGNAITSSGGGTGYIVSLFDGGTTGTLVIRNVHGTFADTNTLTSGGTTATINGTPSTIVQSKQAPFGTFSGGKFFGARGIWLDNVASADSSNFQLIDSLGVTQTPPVTVKITVKDANTLTAIEGSRVLLEADAGGDLPAEESVTITRSGSTASVSHSTHGMTTGMSVIIRGATEDEYNGIFTISNVTTNAYDYTVSGTPTTPATGTITATCAILSGLTNVSGILQTTTFNYTNPQPIAGKVRRATTGTKYKTGAITGTITSAGLDTTVLMISDE